jgi:hypothetical protein
MPLSITVIGSKFAKSYWGISMTNAIQQLVQCAYQTKRLQQLRASLTDAAILEALDLYQQQFQSEASDPGKKPSQIVYAVELPGERLAQVTLRFVTQKPTAKNNTALAEIEELIEFNIFQLRADPYHDHYFSRLDTDIADLKAKVEQYQKRIINLQDERLRYAQTVSPEVDELLNDREEVIANCTVKNPQLSVEVKESRNPTKSKESKSSLSKAA